jgi:hypothetical protein
MDAALAHLVRQRAGDRCEYCRLPQSRSSLRFHVEHIVARQHGGQDASENLAFACPECNRRKGTNLTGLDSDTGRVVRLFHPRQDRWENHFLSDGPRVLARTDVGRTTAWLLAMNSAPRLRWRDLLHRLGEWP